MLYQLLFAKTKLLSSMRFILVKDDNPPEKKRAVRLTPADSIYSTIRILKPSCRTNLIAPYKSPEQQKKFAYKIVDSSELYTTATRGFA